MVRFDVKEKAEGARIVKRPRAYTEILVNASDVCVWDVLTDMTRYSEWNPMIYRAAGNPSMDRALKLCIRPPGLLPRRVVVVVTAFEPRRIFGWLGRWGLPRVLDGDHRYVIESLSADRTRVVQVEEFSGILARPLAPWLIRGIEAGFNQANRALKERCELFHSVHKFVGTVVKELDS